MPEYYSCDHCGGDVPENEVQDCVPDETGYCIRCGQRITEETDD